ncbi:hypothetical protein [Clostridium sp. B9]|uniref:hypothetical protein n=1 Tax=Clostridium sp. B9 TaxID=3423224 RepID=UPI003D2ECA17
MNKNMEMMKKLIEEKKNKGKNLGGNVRAAKSIGTVQHGRKKNNGGGLFDK